MASICRIIVTVFATYFDWELFITIMINSYNFNLMKSSPPVLSINLLPPDKLYCNFTYWSSLFSQDMQILWDRAHGVPLEKLPKGISDLIFPYLLLALSDYKTSQINKMNGIGLDNLLSLWFDKYSLNKNGYFELIKK